MGLSRPVMGLLSIEKIKVSLKSDKSDGYITWRLIYFLIISRSFLLRMRNVSDRSYRENEGTYFMFNNFFNKNHAADEIVWENIVQPDRPQMTV
jgi:hypothetical protein